MGSIQSGLSLSGERGTVHDKCNCIVVDGEISILAFIIVQLLTGTNFPAVSVNSLLAVVMRKTRER